MLAAAGMAGLVFAAAGTAAADGPVPGAAPASAASEGGRVRLTLPDPSGPLRIGTTSLHLIDRARLDPWTSPPSSRELMISLWYPARDTRGHRRAPWLPPKTAAAYRQQSSQSLQTSLDRVDFPLTHAFEGAPVEARRGHPVVLFTPGFGAERQFGTALVEELASRGYVVVTIDHTHEASFVEFPGGRLEPSRQPDETTDADIATALRVRQDDTRFVLDSLAALNAGTNLDAEHRPLPHGLRGSLDLSRTGMFGHSLGGDTAAEAMAEDPRILAGADLDGSINGPVADTGLDRPFLLMSNADHGRNNDPSWERFWSNLRGWRRDLLLHDSGHQTYTDLSPLIQQLIRSLPIPPQVVTALIEYIGTIDADRAITVQRAYLTSFFNLHLRDSDDHLLSAPSPRYPELEFIP